MGFYDAPHNTPGTLTSQLSSDTTKTNSIALSMVGIAVQTISTLTAATILGFIFDWRITLINLGFLPFIMIASLFGSRIQQGFSGVDDVVDGTAGGIISECVCNTKTIYSYNMQDKVVKMYKKVLKNGFKTINKSTFVNGLLFGFSQFCMYATYSGIFYAGGTFVSEGTLTIKNMFRSMFVLLFAGFGLGQVQQYVANISAARAALVNIFKVLDEPSSIDPLAIRDEKYPQAYRPQSIQGKIEFRNVKFSYPTRKDLNVFDNLSFTIEAGQKAAFVGHSGCGKSSIIQLIERFYDPEEGKILIDDKDIKEYDLISLRSFISLVMQEPILFKKDIIENIRYGKLDASDEEIRLAATRAKMSHYLSPEYDKNIIPVSGGEKQRIAIARAIIKDPKILLLDEATSALDNQNEKDIQECIDEIMPGRTTITIAHKLSTVINSNIIFVMDEGKIIEKGTHSDLYDQMGKYYHLYNAGQKLIK
jgi:ATP-binding cassette subfamily B (MDR/TAP) protein 1